jgi:fibronectin-binding autotransporter adhesin
MEWRRHRWVEQHLDFSQGATVNVVQRVARAVVEGLEGRVLFGAHTWTGAGGDSNWSDASNWTGGAPAAAESNVTLDFPSVSNTSPVNDITGLTIQSISLEASYYLSGQSFSLAGSISTSGGGGGSLNNNIVLTGNSSLNLAGQLNIGGTISGSANLQQNGGTVDLSGNNTYTGTTTVVSGLLYLGSNTGLGNTSARTIVDSGGAIMLDPGISCAEPLTLSGTGVSSFPLAPAALFTREGETYNFATTSTWSGPITLSGGASVSGRPASDGGSTYGVQATLDITGAIGGTGNLTIAEGGVILAGANTYAGSTIATAGTLTLNSSSTAVAGNLTVNGGSVETKSSGQIASTSAVTLASGTTLTIDSGDTESVGSLTGFGTLNGAGTLVDNTTGNDNFSGPINGSVSFTLAGNGGLFLDGSTPDSTTGQISLSHGDLVVNADLPNATLHQTGGELGGGGTVSSFTSTSGNMELGPFNPGILTVSGAVNLTSGSTFDWIAVDGSTYTGLNAGGAITIAGNFAIAGLGSGYTPAAGTVFPVIHNTTSSAVSGTFIGMPEGHVIAYQNGNWQISYVGGDGNDVTLTYLGLPTTISASTTATPAVLGQTVLHATVTTPVNGSPTPTGSVTFKNGSTVLGTAPLNSGTASFAASSLPVGTYTLTAYYTGDTVFETSGPSTGVAQVVTQAPSTLGLNASSATVLVASPVTLTATVHAGGIPIAPTGTVTFSSNGVPIGAANVDGSGNATLATSSLAAGNDSITARYGGDANFSTSSTSSPTSVSVLPGVSPGNVTITKSATGGTADFVLTLTTASSTAITLNYATQDGTAMAGRDYVSASGTVTFAPGQTSQTIPVTMLGDSTWQPNRTFSIVYSSVSNALLAATSSTATIQSSDGMPAAGVIPDELDPAQNDLVVVAPAGNDTIQLKTTKVAGQVQVVINRKTVATNTGIDRVIVYGGAGNNTLTIAPRVRNGVIFFSGGKRTVATGGAGNDILVGGNGPNTLGGGGGMNLLIGGPGKATLHGSPAGDVLVGGATEYDSGTLSDIYSLEILLNTWTTGGAYATRAAALAAVDAASGATLGPSAVALNPADHLTGKKNHDLLLAAVVTNATARAATK